MNILFHENSDKKTITLTSDTVKDLALYEIVSHIGINEKERGILRNIFTNLPCNPDDIRYRQEIMKDFLENDDMTDELTEALGQIETLKEYASFRTAASQNDKSLYSLLEKLRELSVYVNVSETIVKSLQKSTLKSEGLRKVLGELSRVVSDEHFAQTKEDINAMLEDLSCVRSALVGVNFTPDLNVEQVMAVEFLPHPVRSKYKLADFGAFMHNISNANVSNAAGMSMNTIGITDPLLVTMTPQIEKHLKTHFMKIKHAMRSHIKEDGSMITPIYEGLIYYLAMARFARNLKKKGYQFCFPTLTDRPRTFEMKDFYNIRLVLSGEENIVKNDFSFTPKENLYLLTGPNRGGKTIVEQALGIISVMTSIGSFVTAASCTGQPFSNILTHFPIDENLTINYGRLGEEAVRIKEIVRAADDRTLILFNETYSTTSSADGLYLSMDLLHILKELGTAAIFNTHIHELAKVIDEMNEWDGESDLVSIVMEIKDNVNTFRLKRSAPELKSYAHNIATKYEITYEQMKNSRFVP